MEFPENLKYTDEHEWVQREGDTVLIGVTDYAQSELGDVVFLELPEPGVELSQGAVFGTIEAVKTVSDLFSPVTGEVLEVNTDLADQPELVNQSPYADGWMIKVRLTDASELDSLFDADHYRDHVGENG